MNDDATNESEEFPPELARLLAALQEESLEPAQRRRLAQLLREYPSALHLYVHLTQLRILLEEEFGTPPALAPARTSPVEPHAREVVVRGGGGGGGGRGIRPARLGCSGVGNLSADDETLAEPPYRRPPARVLPRGRWWSWLTVAAAVFALGGAGASLVLAVYGRG